MESPGSDSEEFEVEEIRDIRLNQRRIEVLIKWKFYSNDQNTWEPLANLRRNPVELLE